MRVVQVEIEGHPMQRIIRVLLIAGALSLLIGCFFSVNPPSIEKIQLEDPVMAKAVDENNNPIQPTTTFKTTDKRIYASICTREPSRVRLGARWYFTDKLITDQVIMLDNQRCGAWFLESPPGGTFPAGDYRIEIYLVKSADKVLHFKVVE